MITENGSRPRISVLVVSWNGLDLLPSCLDALRAQSGLTVGEDYEVIVVDNGSDDGSQEKLPPRYEWVQWIFEPGNTGFAQANNRALRDSRGDLIVLVNNDADVAPDFLLRLAEAAETNREYGMFATRIMLWDRREVFDSTGLLVYPDGVCRSRGWLEKDLGQYDDPEEVLGPNGCAAAFRREFFEDVGEFDPDYFAYLEDLDLALRGQLRGWRCLYVPEAVVWHKKSMTGGYHSAFKAFHVERNRVWNAVKLLPLRLLLLSPVYTLARFVAQGFAAATGRGMPGGFRRDYGRGQLARILARAWWAALLGMPAMLRKRAEIQGHSRLGAWEVYRMLVRYRLPLLELAFKD